MHDSRHCSAPQHAVTYIKMPAPCTSPPAPHPLCPYPFPSLVLTIEVALPLRDKYQCVRMCRCWSIIVTGQARADGNKPIFPPSPHCQAHGFLRRGVLLLSGHWWPLTPKPFLHRGHTHTHTVKPQLTFSWVVCSITHLQTHFQTKTLVCWHWVNPLPLSARSGRRSPLQVISAQGAEINRASSLN